MNPGTMEFTKQPKTKKKRQSSYLPIIVLNVKCSLSDIKTQNDQMGKKENKIQRYAAYQRCFSLKHTHKTDSDGMEKRLQSVTDRHNSTYDKTDFNNSSKKCHYVMIKQ